jgi:hypothetical protein
LFTALRRRLRKWRFGDEIVVVSGLPRSGTSMMMSMLRAGGLQVLADGIREADVDNPNGYFEDERVKDLENMEDKAWVAEGRGKVLKVISFLLKDLPTTNAYRIIFMRRDLDEILASQNKMIAHRGAADTTEDEAMKALYRSDIARARVLRQRSPAFEMLEIHYTDVIHRPEVVAKQVNVFLGGQLNEEAMATVVDPNLYRNRSA